MKNHIAIKFLALLLCACSLLAVVGSAAGVIFVAQAGLYTQDISELKEQTKEDDLQQLAQNVVARYACENLSNCTTVFLDRYIGEYHPRNLAEDAQWFYTIEDQNGQILFTNDDGTAGGRWYDFVVIAEYPVILDYKMEAAEEHLFSGLGSTGTVQPDELVTIPTSSGFEEDFLYWDTVGWRDSQNNKHTYEIAVYRTPAYRVSLRLMPGAYVQQTADEWELLEMAYQYRFQLIYLLLGGLLTFAITGVYLCCSAGKKPGVDGLRPGGMNRLPLDLYLTAAGAGVVLLSAISVSMVMELIFTFTPLWLLLLGAGLVLYAACLLVVGFLFACAAQFKMPGIYWWRHSITGRICHLAVRVIRQGLGLCRRMLVLLPLTWQWLLTAAGMAALILLAILFRSEEFLLFAVLVCIGVVIYACRGFGVLSESAKRMSSGDLFAKVDTKHLYGCFADFADDLNTLTDVVRDASQKQAKSERMKAELVTNVSHDIKTPLTSIINYVDLLQKTDSPQERQAYLEVLDRQSQRLKKLIDDLMEMSKASTGNMTVEVTALDAAEAINQALGEFADKLTAAGLTPVFHQPESPITMVADGRLTWRVLSNLLSNAVKYAMPGTRLYIDLMQLEGSTLISLKNISAQPLNISSEELMDRFVRGDASRQTDGSGLGLNIAKSLMELQAGSMQLLVDGDLFKVTLVFPAR